MSEEEITRHKKLLSIYRSSVGIYQQQLRTLGSHSPKDLYTRLKVERRGLQKVKEELRSIGYNVQPEPVDSVQLWERELGVEE